MSIPDSQLPRLASLLMSCRRPKESLCCTHSEPKAAALHGRSHLRAIYMLMNR
jgi:hypothetical protein